MTDTAVSPEPELTPEQTKDKALRAAYTKASQKVREDHRDEFNEAMAAFAKEAGYEWTPRSTAEDRARETVANLFKDFPSLREEFLPEPPE